MIQQTKTDRERFVALSRICLNNWHYISRKTLSFSEEINFFTGHSGSGKSTVIDAMQIVLYANTDGRGFFNKAAADDSDRSLIEYLRGMVNIGENNEFAYLRNRNFSTTIILELKQTDTEECQCVGIVFDVETASNEISRKFFWHKGPLWENNYRTEGRAMTIAEVEEEMLRSYGKEECFYTSHNERFRRLLYDVYLGGLDQEKFPLLFKRAIPFRMNIKLEDFVKEYICMEQDIHIEDMQESVMQYGRMRQKIEDTCREIEEIKELAAQYRKVLDIRQVKEKTREKKRLEDKLLKLKEQNIDEWEKGREAVEALRFAKEEEIRETGRQIDRSRDELERYKKEAVWQQGELSDRERSFTKVQELEDRLDEFLSKRENPRLDKLGDYFKGRAAAAEEARDRAFEQLLGRRLEYLKRYPNRSFSPSAKDNAAYDKLLDTLSCDNLEHYREAAAEQAKTAVEHFKDDFMYKIRSAIREAVQRKDELNRIISSLNFGKDKYQFAIGRNRGADGRFYDMFMDEALEVNPSKLSQTFENQMNFFTMEHENQYGEQINELINIFIPPENASAEEMEEARRNMDKYADYRTYLSFDMQQIIKNDDGIMKLQLSKMIKKNSGGEGQNPLYVALLASFSQAYRIGLPPKLRRSPTIRLVVLDEAFSKMDAEKVASCIQLIRDLGFQAIISATNDKIQNYVENVNKTFVFANPNKKAISIREFEREEMPQLMKGLV